MKRRAAGVNIPVFSLRSQRGMGTGEFLDLIPLIDWAKQSGLKVIQLLPINDTSSGSEEKGIYPYSILSSFALHPLYLNLLEIAPDLEDMMLPIMKELNRPQLDYQKTMFAKGEFLKLIFELYGEETLKSRSFAAFMKRSEDRLKPYAAYLALRKHYETGDFGKWGKHKRYSDLLVEEVCEKFPVAITYFVQYHLDKQMRAVHKHAKEAGVILKGDFPMGVQAHSVEAWRFDEYFRWDVTMGAPPDFYNSYGQNWGFPSYNWNEMREEGFFWLKSRLKWMEQYFDAIRLDHVLGYFRLWEIPKEEIRGLMGNFFPALGYSKEELNAAGLTGYKSEKKRRTQQEVQEKVTDQKKRTRLFNEIEDSLFFERQGSLHPRIDVTSTNSFKELPKKEQEVMRELSNHYFLERQEEIWRKFGLEKLKVIQKGTKMEVCAEDIGVIPACVSDVLKELEMLNLHVQRMPKSFEIEFEHPEDFPETCVCTPSNHDTSTLRQWWEENQEATARYYHCLLLHEGDPPKQLSGKLASEIIEAHLKSKARYAIFLIQDLLAMSEELRIPEAKSERVNDPADPNYTWDYRMHLYVEELLLAKGFSQKIKEMVEEAKR